MLAAGQGLGQRHGAGGGSSRAWRARRRPVCTCVAWPRPAPCAGPLGAQGGGWTGSAGHRALRGLHLGLLLEGAAGRVRAVLTPRRRTAEPRAVALERRAGRGSAVHPPTSCLLLSWAASSLLLSTRQLDKVPEGPLDGRAHSGQGYRLCCPSARLRSPVCYQPCGCGPSCQGSGPQPSHLWGLLPRWLAVMSCCLAPGGTSRCA